MMKTVRSDGPVLLLALIFLALGTVYSVATPVFETPDEVWHFAYIRYVAQRADLPVQGAHQGEELAQQEASQPPLYYMLTAPLVRLIDSSDFARVGKLNPHAAPGLPNNDGNKNMVVPSPAPFPWHGTVLAVHIVRFVSLLLGLLTVLCTYALGRHIWSATTGVVALPQMRRQELSHFTNGDSTTTYLPLLLAAVVAFNPQFIFISASVNNDNAMNALAALTVALIARIAADPQPRPLSRRRIVALGVLAGLAALSKLTGVILLGFIAIALLIITVQRRPGIVPGAQARSILPVLRSWLRALVPVVLIAAAIAGWWYARNWMLYHDITGLRPMLVWVGERRLSLGAVASELSGLELSFWAVFGWFNVLVDEWIYTALKVVARVAALGLVVFAARWLWSLRRRVSNSEHEPGAVDVRILALAALWVAIVMAGLVRWTATTPGTQGRLIFPAIGCLAALLLTGLSAFIPRRWQAAALAIPIAALLTVAVVVPFRYILPAYARPAVMSSSPDPANPVHVSYGDGEIELLGYDVDRTTVTPGSNVAVTVYLQALRPMETDYSLFIHLWGVNMQWLGQRDSYPGRGSLPASRMTPGAIIEDRYLVSIPVTATAPARVRVEIGFYDYENGQRLWATTPDGKRTDVPFVGRFKLAAAKAVEATQRPSLFSFGQQANLVAAQIETPPVVQAGSAITVATTWQATAATAQDYTIFMQVLDEKNAIVAQLDGQPQGGEYPTGLWDKDEVVTDRRTITLPATLSPGRYRIVTGLYLLATLQRLPVAGPNGAIAENQAQIGEFMLR